MLDLLMMALVVVAGVYPRAGHRPDPWAGAAGYVGFCHQLARRPNAAEEDSE
jgi:hypothetical protein